MTHACHKIMNHVKVMSHAVKSLLSDCVSSKRERGEVIFSRWGEVWVILYVAILTQSVWIM